jgi:NitT/TauT family transport system substrate-binding protein
MMLSMIRKRGMVALLVMMLALGLTPMAQAQDAALMDTTLFMTFIPNVQFAPVYVALSKGYFEDAGFNVGIEYGDEPVGVNLIAAGERKFGLVSGEQVLTARSQGLPVVFVYEWFQEYPVGIAAPVETGITTVADLAGKRVGIPGRFGASYSGLIALLSTNGMTEQDIDLQEIGFNAPEVLCVGGVDAAVVYINNEPLQIRQRAAAGDCGSVTDVTVIPVSSGVDMVSNGIVTNEAMIAEHPDQVAAMNAAFDHALADAIRNPAETYLMSVEFVDNLPLSDDLRAALQTAADEQNTYLAENPNADRETIAGRRTDLLESLSAEFDSADLLQFEVLLTSIDLWDADQLGYTDPASWEATEQTLRTMGFLDADLDLTAAYSDAFLPPRGDE